jgi:hypothetical protein
LRRLGWGARPALRQYVIAKLSPLPDPRNPKLLIHLPSQKRRNIEAVVVVLAELDGGLFQRRGLGLFTGRLLALPD